MSEANNPSETPPAGLPKPDPLNEAILDRLFGIAFDFPELEKYYGTQDEHTDLPESHSNEDGQLQEPSAPTMPAPPNESST